MPYFVALFFMAIGVAFVRSHGRLDQQTQANRARCWISWDGVPTIQYQRSSTLKSNSLKQRMLHFTFKTAGQQSFIW